MLPAFIRVVFIRSGPRSRGSFPWPNRATSVRSDRFGVSSGMRSTGSGVAVELKRPWNVIPGPVGLLFLSVLVIVAVGVSPGCEVEGWSGRLDAGGVFVLLGELFEHLQFLLGCEFPGDVGLEGIGVG